MGMFDTIIFDRPILCPKCGAEIRPDQVKAFECMLDEYRIGDCIVHAEEIRIVSGELHCEASKAFSTRYWVTCPAHCRWSSAHCFGPWYWVAIRADKAGMCGEVSALFWPLVATQRAS